MHFRILEPFEKQGKVCTRSGMSQAFVRTRFKSIVTFTNVLVREDRLKTLFLLCFGSLLIALACTCADRIGEPSSNNESRMGLLHMMYP